MEDFQTGRGSISIWAAIAMIGGFLAIVSLWLATTKINADFTITGWEFLTNEVDGVDAGDTFKFWRFMPFFAAIAGLGVVVFTALPAVGVNNPTFKILGMIFGILLIALMAANDDGKGGDQNG